MVSPFRSIWRAVRNRGRFERDMDDELAFHLDQRTDAHIRNGLSRDEAARTARLEFGNPEAWQDRCREARGLGLVDALRTDVQFGWRSIRKNVLLSVTVVSTLALGIGANTAMFSVLHSVLNPVSYPEADRLVFLNCRATMPNRAARVMGWSYPKFVDLAAMTTSFEAMAAVGGMDVNLTTGGDAERIRGEIISGNYFSTLGVGPILGTLLLPDDPSAPATAALGESLWRRRFGANPAIIGTAVDLNGTAFTVAGVVPDEFTGETGRAEIWLPLSMTPAVSPNPTRLQERMAHWLVVVARMRRGVNLARADEDLKLAVRRMEEMRPSSSRPGADRPTWDGTAAPLLESKIDPGIRGTLNVLVIAVGCVLLIASLNIASMFLGRAVVRRREVAIRLAIGASRGTVVRQFLTESLMLAAIGGVLGFAVAGAGLTVLTRLGFEVPATPGAPFVRNLELESITLGAPAVVAYAVLLAAIAGLVFGLAPALQASNLAITDALKVSRGGWSAGRRRAGAPTLRRGLLIAQIALAVVLLSGAGLMIRTFNRLLATEIGVNYENVLTFRLELPASQYSAERGTQALEALTASLQQLPGVRSASVSNTMPLQGQMEMTNASIDGIRQTGDVGVHMVSARYFEALHIPLIRGRLLTDQDRASSQRVAVVSETAARNFTSGGDVIGRRISLGLNGWGAGSDAEIVGVVGDVKYQLLTMPFVLDVYLSYMQRPPLRAQFLMRTDADSQSVVPLVRRRVAEMDQTLPVFAVRSLSEIVARTTAGTRSTTLLLGLFSGLALLLACVGLYGVLAYSVTSRTREIGVRMALGAQPVKVVQLVGREVLVIGVSGLAAGLIGARVAGRALAGLLYQVQPTDPATLVTVSLVLTLAICLAGLLPARRASRINPLVALRED
jgi:putative ABC transport system permease protein